jgi:hypothetical protein
VNRGAGLMERAAPVLCGAAVIAVLLALISRDYPLVGHDFAYFIPRLLDTDLHLRINGPSIQWYTPTFGGGLPAFANPQHLEYSLPQALLYVTGPWPAILLATTIVSALGYAACYAFLSGTLGLERVPSALGAAFFIGNGFFIEHLIAGHVNYQLFPMAAVILYVLTNRTQRTLTNGCLAALSVAMIIHQAGSFLLILTAGSIVLAGQVVYLIDRRRVAWDAALGACVVAVPLSLGIAGSKVFAVQSLMRQFPREVADTYPVGMLHGLAGLASQLAGGMTIIPALMLAGRGPQQVDGALVRMTGASWRVWETDTGLSPVLLIVLLIGLVQLLWSIRKRGMSRPAVDTTLMLIVLGVTAWIAVEATLAKGLVYPALRTLPILRSLHVNTRIAAVFILPLSIVGAFLLNRWYAQRPRRWHVAAVLCLTLASPLIYLVLPGKTHLRSFDLSSSIRDHQRIRNGDRFPITRIADVWDVDTFAAQSSSIYPYEPLFGYYLEVFAPRTHVGSIYDERDGQLNMTNPASLVFPELNHLRPFDLIRADDRANLERLATRRQPDWKIPPIIQWLNILAVATLAVCIVIPLVGGWRTVRSRPRPGQKIE